MHDIYIGLGQPLLSDTGYWLHRKDFVKEEKEVDKRDNSQMIWPLKTTPKEYGTDYLR